MRGTQVSLKNTPVGLKSTQVSLSSSPFSIMVSIYVGGCLCLACLACMAGMARTFGSHASHVWLAGSHIGHTLGMSYIQSKIQSFRLLFPDQLYTL